MTDIYFIRSGNKGRPIKIGYTRNIEKRMEALQVGNPNKLHLIALIPIKSLKIAKKIERMLHSKFKKLHIRGEWYSGKIELTSIMKVIDVAKDNSVDDLYEREKGKVIKLNPEEKGRGVSKTKR